MVCVLQEKFQIPIWKCIDNTKDKHIHSPSVQRLNHLSSQYNNNIE